MKVRLADMNVEIESRYGYTGSICRPYAVEMEGTDIDIRVTDSEILREYDGAGHFSRGYLESLAVYRKLADAIPRYRGVLMHGVLMEADGKGILLCAPSGVGKSTHASFWLELLGAERCHIVNGDKPLVRVIDGTVYAYGTPWCGKEGLNENRRVRLETVCFISRSENDITVPVSVDEAFQPLMLQIHFPDSDEARLSVLDVIGDIMQSVDFFEIKCTPRLSAAREAYRAIFRKKDEN